MSTAMMSVFSSWLPSKPLSGVEAEDVLTPLPSSSDQPQMSPLDRSRTPRAPQQLQSQPNRKLLMAEHSREPSDATLDGRMYSRPTAEAGSLGPHLPRLTNDAMEAHRLHHATDGSHYYHAEKGAPGSRRSSSGAEHAATTFSSTLGGVDSEAAWSDAHGHSDTQASSTSRLAPPRRRKIAPPELLVIVRPPPSKQVNALNLQIQLVMPAQRRDASIRRKSGESSRSRDSPPPPAPAPLRRSGSTFSTTSGASDVSTAASTSSSASGKRVMPLYNLGFHTIMSSVVTDAGTDQKVAKYTRRGVDLDGFGLLEPTELVTGVNDLATLYRAGLTGLPSARGDCWGDSNGSDEAHSVLSAPPQEQAASAPRSPFLEPPTSFQAMTPEAKGQELNLGGKLLGKFKRLSMGMKPLGGPLATPASTIGPPQSQASVFEKIATKVNSEAASVTFAAPPASGEVLQMTPGAGVVDGKKTEGYFWTVRKWNRRTQHGTAAESRSELPADGSNVVLNSVWKRFNLINRMGGNERPPPARDIPIRIEWSRESKWAHKRRADEEAYARVRASASLSTSRSSLDKQHATNGNGQDVSGSSSSINFSEAGLHPPRSDHASAICASPSRRSSTARRMRSPRRSNDCSAASSSGLHPSQTREDSGEESDPEDSETPWSCHLALGPTTRIPIGTLSPAPHHPKLVGQLAVPFPLPDLSNTGLGLDGAGLTREELKDIIMVTCLHLIVRENFGGLVKRKSRPTTSSGASIVENGAAARLSAPSRH